MGVTIGAEGYIGIALETTPSEYEAPTKFFPIRNESLTWSQNTNQRRVIRGTADVIGAVPGNGNVEGDIDMELLSDVLPYFLMCARGTLIQDDGPEAGSFQYNFVPAHNAVAPNTMSITIVRGEEAFGYVGCVVASQNYSVDNDMAVVTFTVLGTSEESVAAPAAPIYTDDVPYGAGMWKIQIPTDTQIYDADSFSFEVDDNGEVQNRLKDELGAQFISFGERNTSLSLDRDFENRDEYNDFKLLTEKSVSVEVEESTTNRCKFTIPVAFIDDYAVNLSGVGDLVRSSNTYIAVHDDDTGGAYEIELVTDEDLGLAP